MCVLTPQSAVTSPAVHPTLAGSIVWLQAPTADLSAVQLSSVSTVVLMYFRTAAYKFKRPLPKLKYGIEILLMHYFAKKDSQSY